MPYTLSKARADFEAAIVEIARRLKVAGKAGTPTDLKEYAIAASIFLAHGEIENYFEDVYARIARLYCATARVGSSLPPDLRAHVFLVRSNITVAIGKHLAGGGENKSIAAMANALGGPPGALVNDSIPLTAFDGRDIYTNHKYPSLTNIERVLARIGIRNGKANINRVGRRNVVALLESLGALRTSLAHNASLPGLSVTDVARLVKETRLFVSAFDRLLYEHTTTCGCGAHWNAEMR